MGRIRIVEPVKLLIGLIAVSEEIIIQAERQLVAKWGAVDTESPIIDFNCTQYYASEMGKGLLRKWVCFEKLIDPIELAPIKVSTNEMEKKHSLSTGRMVNIDPGYLCLPKVILASTKDFNHRIYLSHGIYAELTLIYKAKCKKYTGLPWSYPDYQSAIALDFLLRARKKYHQQILKIRAAR